MKKKTQIKFDFDETADISDEIIEISDNYYIKKTSKIRNSLRFPIPTAIKITLDLKVSDLCYFCIYTEGMYISFKHYPEYASKYQVKSRKLSTAGSNNTLYVVIPPMFKNLYKKEIYGVKLIQPKGFKEYEWQIQFLFTECI